MAMMGEVWADVPDYEGIYEVSTLGRVKRIKPGPNTKVGKILTPRLDTQGRPTVCLYNTELHKWRKEWRVHQLVARAFIDAHPADGLEVCHGNGDKTDNRVENLRWDTSSANKQDAIKHGTAINQNTGKTHCKRGHELAGDNLIMRRNSKTGKPMRNCRKCCNMAQLKINKDARKEKALTNELV